MAQTITPDLFESNKVKQVNSSNQEWSLQKVNKTVQEQMEHTLIVENKKVFKGVVQSKYPTNIY
ncbi:MAG: hypothetical protein SPLM_09330 [Spiroplasma phoeniceum]|uniref:hypothetical protein n=1 Tax=Spiroplasma phoeniceum TaxID=47835 RepID=UPI003133FAF4